MPPTAEEQTATMIANLEKNTGAKLSVWLERARAAGADKHVAVVKRLKTEHGLTHGFANLVAHKLKEAAADGPAAGRLEASGSFNAMVSHRVRLTTLAEVDDALTAWLQAAYDAAG